MPDDQPIKILSSLVGADYKVLDPTLAAPAPPGSVLDVVIGPFSIPALDVDYVTMRQTITLGNAPLLDQFLVTCNQNTGGLPGDLRDLATKYVKFLVANSIIANTDAAIKAAVTTILNSFVTSFEAALSFPNLAESQPIHALFPNLGFYGFGNSNDPDQYYLANAMWKDFASSYTYQPNGAVSNTVPSIALGLFQQLRSFTAITSTIMQGTTISVNAGGGTTTVVTSSATPSFEGTFAQYFPLLPVGGATFVTTLQNFARGMIAKYGYFSPSRQFTDWVSYVQGLSNTIAPIVPRLPIQDVRILNEVFFLIVKMITSIQNVAASQADRLALYTSWQKGYTDLLNQVHVFTGSSKDKLKDAYGPFTDAPSLSDVQKRRQDEQGNFNAGMVQQITAYKDTVSEDAKALQSRVNQSTDAFNEQANSATAILQELSTILSAIFR